MTMTREDFRRALCDAMEIENSDIPDDFDYQFSHSFEKQMKKLIRAERRWSWHLINTRKKRLLLAAAILTMLVVTAYGIPYVRAAMSNFFWENFSGYSEMIIAENSVKTVDREFELSTFPKGFKLISKYETAAFIEKTYEDSNGVIWSFSQAAAGSSSGYSVDTDTSELIEKYVDGTKITLQISDTDTTAYWMTDGYLLTLDCRGAVDVDTMLEYVQLIK